MKQIINLISQPKNKDKALVTIILSIFIAVLLLASFKFGINLY